MSEILHGDEALEAIFMKHWIPTNETKKVIVAHPCVSSYRKLLEGEIIGARFDPNTLLLNLGLPGAEPSRGAGTIDVQTKKLPYPLTSLDPTALIYVNEGDEIVWLPPDLAPALDIERSVRR